MCVVDFGVSPVQLYFLMRRYTDIMEIQIHIDLMFYKHSACFRHSLDQLPDLCFCWVVLFTKTAYIYVYLYSTSMARV